MHISRFMGINLPVSEPRGFAKAESATSKKKSAKKNKKRR